MSTLSVLKPGFLHETLFFESDTLFFESDTWFFILFLFVLDPDHPIILVMPTLKLLTGLYFAITGMILGMRATCILHQPKEGNQ